MSEVMIGKVALLVMIGGFGVVVSTLVLAVICTAFEKYILKRDIPWR